jgi:SAM-dependent methyltransferase
MAVFLDQIVPWGRSRREYELMFGLDAKDLAKGVLDCGGGPASFTAELSEDGLRAVSVDPIYAFSGAEIQARFETIVEPMLSQVRATPDDWTWSYHGDPDQLGANRRAVIEKFLADYDDGRRNGRYVIGELPSLPFEAKSFGLAICSHLLFLYSDLLSEDFHVRSVLELCRVSDEVRLFPLVTLRGELSPHITAVQSALELEGWKAEVGRVSYELQRGGNQMLRIFPR